MNDMHVPTSVQYWSTLLTGLNGDCDGGSVPLVYDVHAVHHDHPSFAGGEDGLLITLA